MNGTSMRFDALTSLRFFAALMIVLHHWAERYSPTLHHVPLSSGVSFFFVLSGFVIACAYPSFAGRGDVSRFLLARISRLAPTHWATMLIAAAGLVATGRLAIGGDLAVMGVVNGMMLQSWMPLREFYFSFNAVSWSISTELAFYFLYVLFVCVLPGSMAKKLLAMVLFSLLCLAASVWAWIGRVEGEEMPSLLHWLVYIFPLSRFWEFLLGCWLFGLSSDVSNRFVRVRERHPNLLQGVSLLVGVGAVALLAFLSALLAVDADSSPIYLWLFTCSLAPVYGFVIFSFATPFGRISRLLQRRWLLELGEASFLLYMVHRFFLNGLPGLLKRFQNGNVGIDTWAGMVIYVGLAVLFSWAGWRFLERQVSVRFRSALFVRFLRKPAMSVGSVAPN